MRPSAKARILIRPLVVAALAVAAAPALCLAQAAGGEDITATGQGLANGSSTPGAALPGATLPGETSTQLGPEPAELLRYGIAAGIGETDNVNLSPTNPKSQTIAAADLDFDLKRTGSRLDAAARGNFTDLDYLQGAYSNQLLGRFDGLATAKLWSDRLRWVVADDYGEQQTDPFAAMTPVNLQRVNVFSTGPDLTLRPSYSTFVNIEARYSQNSYQSSPFDGHNLLGSAALGRRLSDLSSLSLVVQAEELRFDNTIVNTDFDRREAYARYLIKGARTSIDAQLGATQANDATASWKTSPLVRLQLTRQVSPFSVVTVAGGREFTDAAGSFRSLTSGAGGGIAVAPVSQTTANYQRTYGSAGWEFARLRTTFGFSGEWERDKYDVQSVFDATRAELGFNLGRSITSKLSLNITGSADRYEYLNQGFTDKFGTVGGGVAYRPGRWVIVYARYDHAFRRSSGIPSLLIGGSGYDENRAFIMIGYRPHSGGMDQGQGGSLESEGGSAP
ncbi:MAG TPA: hypothetical protein VGN43_06895 [Steroidobacteraceae bacterium]|nr:hypothetical protein [Steroidobacteraceae bacterium]